VWRCTNDRCWPYRVVSTPRDDGPLRRKSDIPGRRRRRRLRLRLRRREARRQGLAGESVTAALSPQLVESFLRDDRFLLASPNTYNQLGVGTTQLYDKTVVYNHKRHGRFSLGGRTFDFRMKASFPKSLTKEFLLVDLVNNLDQLPENREQVLKRVEQQVFSSDKTRLQRYPREYGNVRTRKFFHRALATHAALNAA
jgi:hypothetical protein